MALVYKNGKWVVDTQGEATTDPSTSPAPSSSPTADFIKKPQEDSGFDLGRTIGNLFKRPDSKPVDIGEFLKNIGTSIVEGAKKTGLTIADLSAQGDAGFNLLDKAVGGGTASQDIQKDVVKQQDVLAKIKEERQKTQSPIEKTVGDVAEFVAPTVATLPIGGEGALGTGGLTGVKALLAKGTLGGLDFAGQSQLIFNPSEHPEGEQAQARLNDGLISFASGFGLPIVAEALKPVVKPMVNAVKSLADGVINKLSSKAVEDTFQAIKNPADIALSRDFSKVSSEDFFNYLKGGEATPEVKKFFASPEWVDIAKKYGANPENYPEFLYAAKPAAAEGAIEQQGVSGLLNAPFGNFKQDLTDVLSQAADSRAKMDVEGQNSALGQLKLLIDTYKENGYDYKFKPEEVVNLVNDFSNHLRAVDDTFREVASLETKQNLVKMLQSVDLYKPIVLVRRIATLLGNKVDDSEKLLTAYNKMQKRMGIAQPWDTITEGLRENGINISDPADLVAFAKSLPTKAEINKKVTEPPPFDLESKIDSVFKLPSTTNKEQPFVVAKSEWDKLKANASPEEKPIIQDVKDVVTKTQTANAESPLVDEGALSQDTMFTPSLKDKILSGVNPFAFETSKLITYGGEPARELVNRGKRAFYTAITTRAEFKDFNKNSGLQLLDKEGLANLRQVMNNTAVPMNEQVANVAGQLRTLFRTWGEKLLKEDQLLEYYFPRVLNEEGQKALSKGDPKSNAIREIAKANNMDVTQFLKLTRRTPKKEFFEYSRVVKEIPEKYQADPLEAIATWQEATARNWGVVSQFGDNGVGAQDLINKILDQATDDKAGRYAAELADKYRTRIFGKFSNYTDLPALSSFIKQSFVISKLSPFTTMANETQGFINSYLDYGVRGLIDANRSVGNKWVKELGLDDMGSSFNENNAGKFAEKWLKVIGMGASEVRGFNRTAASTYQQLQRTWQVLLKDPKNTGALKEFTRHGMFVDPEVLINALQKKELPQEELMMGIMEGVRRKMFFNTPGERPAWATTALGSPAYVFKNYLFSQLRLLKDAPIHRQIAYMAFLAPLTGLPIMLFRRIITGKDLPETPYDWYTSSTTAGAATYLDLYESLNSDYRMVNFGLGAYSPVANLLLNKNKGQAAFEAAPIPFGGLVSGIISAKENKKKEGFTPLETKDTNFEPKFKPLIK